MPTPSARPPLEARDADLPKLLRMREPATSHELLARVEDDLDRLDVDLRTRVPRALLPAALHHLEALRQAAENLQSVLTASEVSR